MAPGLHGWAPRQRPALGSCLAGEGAAAAKGRGRDPRRAEGLGRGEQARRIAGQPAAACGQRFVTRTPRGDPVLAAVGASAFAIIPREDRRHPLRGAQRRDGPRRWSDLSCQPSAPAAAPWPGDPKTSYLRLPALACYRTRCLRWQDAIETQPSKRKKKRERLCDPKGKKVEECGDKPRQLGIYSMKSITFVWDLLNGSLISC